jgi:hypothetical protein
MQKSAYTLQRPVVSILAGLALYHAAAVGYAADADNRYRVRAIDAVKTCYTLTRAVKRAKEEDDWGALYGFSLYTMGYLTAISRLAFDTYDIGGKQNSKTQMVWLEKYCAEHPDDTFDAALYRLTTELYPDRSTVAPR